MSPPAPIKSSDESSLLGPSQEGLLPKAELPSFDVTARPSSPESSYSPADPFQKGLAQLEQVKQEPSWNTNVTGQFGRWDITQATNLQSNNRYLNGFYRQVNTLAGDLAFAENLVSNAAGNLFIDLPAAVEDLSVSHGGPSFSEIAVSLQAATPGVPDEAIGYGLSKLAGYSKSVAPLIRAETVIQETEKAIQIEKNIPSVERLFKAAVTPDRNGLTKAGRGLQKHSSRLESIYPKPPSNQYAAYNQKGQEIVEEILRDPHKTVKTIERGQQNMIDIASSDGRKIRFDDQGNFIGFREPNEK